MSSRISVNPRSQTLLDKHALPTVAWEVITPAIAEQWLEHYNERNRSIRESHVKRLARDMEEGKWNGLNGETICFDSDGRLTDGQHRLKACVLSGLEFVALVVRGVPLNSYFTSGIGAKKSLSDFLSPEGEKNSLLLSATLRWVFLWMNDNLGQSKSGDTYPTIPEMILTLEQNPEVRESVNWVSNNAGVRGIITPSLASLVHYAGTLSGNYALVSDFLDRLGNGLGLLENNAIFHLRRFLLSQKSSKRKTAQPHNLALLIKSWNYILDEKPCLSLRMSVGEDFPRLR